MPPWEGQQWNYWGRGLQLVCVVQPSPLVLLWFLRHLVGWFAWKILSLATSESLCIRRNVSVIVPSSTRGWRTPFRLKHLAKWVYEVEWVSEVKVILWPWSKITQISKLKLVFLKNSWIIWNQHSYKSLTENRTGNLYKWVGSHNQHGRHAHIW